MAQLEVTREAELLPDFGLFEASHTACPVLPQYHPKQLMELLNSGKIRWVKAILGHLVRCISRSGGAANRQSKSGSMSDDGSRSPRNWSKSRTLSVSYPAGSVLPLGGPMQPGGVVSPVDMRRPSVAGLPEELTLDYTEISSIPPLPLWTLLATADERSATGNIGGIKDGEVEQHPPGSKISP